GMSQYFVADSPASTSPGSPLEEFLAYLSRAIETPRSVGSWADWWRLNEKTVRQAFSRSDYLKLKHRKLLAAEAILEQNGWHPPLGVDRDPVRTRRCPTCNEELDWMEFGPGGGNVFCPI